MTVITMPDGQAVDFGDMPPAQIKEIIRQKYPDRYGTAPKTVEPSPPASGRDGFFDILSGIGSVLNPVAAAGNAGAGATTEGGTILDPLAQGVTFGLQDELAGVAGGALNWAGLGPKGWEGTFSEGYDRLTGKSRSQLDAYRKRNPITAGAAELGGAAMTLPVTGGLNVLRIPAAASKGGAIARGVVNNAVGGAVAGGVYGAGTAEGGPGARLEGLLEGGGYGAGLGVAVPAAIGGVKKLFGNPIAAVSHARNPWAGADRLVADAIKKDASLAGLSPDEIIARMEGRQQAGLPVTALDTGEATRQLARSAGNTSPEAHALLAEQTGERVATQYDRLSDFLSRPGIAPGTNAPEKLKLVQAAAERVNRARYKKAYSQGSFGIWNNDLANLTGSADVQKAIRDAIARSKSEAAISGQGQVKMPFKEMPDGTLVPAPGVKPTLEFWDQVQRSLRDMGKQQSGERMTENAALYERLRGRLNSILDREVPEFGNARLGAFKFFQAEDALEAGVKFANMTGDVLKSGAAKDAIQAMSPVERTLFAEGYASEFLNKAAKVPTDHNLVKRIFNNPTTKAQFELALGPQAAREMETRMHIEGIMQEGRQAVVGNSTTARQLIAQQTALFGGRALVGGIAGSVISGDPLSTGSLIGAALMAGIGRRAGVVMTRADEQMMRRVAEMLSSDNPAMVKEAITRVTNNPRMMNAVRAGHEWVSRSLLPLAAGSGGQQAQGNQ